ncbi:MAG: transposase family protein [Xenococcaceae cyanobacterium MO_188.B32]|nr:transposase family protein [Xenococcaceae cyanobacterium MO_188.B32]
MNFATTKSLTAEKFKRRFGVKKKTFERMVKAFKQQIPDTPRVGRPWELGREDQILAALEYWREYRSYFHIATDFAVSESTVCRAVHRVENILIASGLFRLPGKKDLIRGFARPEVIVMDVTETPIERPKRSGKIICTFFGQGRKHDFALFKASGVKFHPLTESLQDSGYQGINQYHHNSYLPKKKPKNGELSPLEKDYNRELAEARIGIEHVNRRLKILKIFSERYRNRRRRYGLRCNLLAAIYNYELSLTA